MFLLTVFSNLFIKDDVLFAIISSFPILSDKSCILKKIKMYVANKSLRYITLSKCNCLEALVLSYLPIVCIHAIFDALNDCDTELVFVGEILQLVIDSKL